MDPAFKYSAKENIKLKADESSQEAATAAAESISTAEDSSTGTTNKEGLGPVAGETAAGPLTSAPPSNFANSSEERAPGQNKNEDKPTNRVVFSPPLVIFGICFVLAMLFSAGQHLVKTNNATVTKLPADGVPTAAKTAIPGSLAEEIVLPPRPFQSNEVQSSTQQDNDYRMLETVYRDIGLGIAELKYSGRTSEATDLRQQFETLRNRLRKGTGFSFSSTSPVHMISTGGTTNSVLTVNVTFDDRPVELVLNSQQALRWEVSLKGKAKVSKVYVLQRDDDSKPAVVTGLPDSVPVKVLRIATNTNADISGRRDRYELIQQCAKFGIQIGTCQTARATEHPWYIGKESVDWRMQMALQDAQLPHALAMAPVRQKLLDWLKKSPPFLSVWDTSAGQLRGGFAWAPNTVSDYVPGVFGSKWAMRGALKMSPQVSFSGPTMNSPQIENLGKKGIFALSGYQVVNGPPIDKVLKSDSPVKKLRYSGNLDLNFNSSGPFTCATAYDATRNRLYVRDSKTLFTVNPDTGDWAGLASLPVEAADKTIIARKRPSVPFKGMAYNPQDDSLYFLDSPGGNHIDDATFLTRYSLDGTPIERTQLSVPLPSDSYSNPFCNPVSLTYHAPYLIAVTNAPVECPRMDSTQAGWQTPPTDRRPYAWVIDPRSARVLMSMPIEFTHREFPSVKPVVNMRPLITQLASVTPTISPPRCFRMPEPSAKQYGLAALTAKMDSARAGIAWLVSKGREKEANILTNKLNNFDTTKPELASSKDIKPEVHFVALGDGRPEHEFSSRGVANINLDYKHAPIILVLNNSNYRHLTANLKVSPGTTVQKVVLTGTTGNVSVKGIPSAVPILRLNSPAIYYQDDDVVEEVSNLIAEQVGYAPVTFIPRNDDGMYTVGNTNLDWKAQHDAFLLDPLEQECTAAQRQDCLDKLKTARFHSAFKATDNNSFSFYEFDINGPNRKTEVKVQLNSWQSRPVYSPKTREAFYVEDAPYVRSPSGKVTKLAQIGDLVGCNNTAMDDSGETLWLECLGTFGKYDLRTGKGSSFRARMPRNDNPAGLTRSASENCFYQLDFEYRELLKFDDKGNFVSKVHLSKQLEHLANAECSGTNPRLYYRNGYIIALCNGLLFDHPASESYVTMHVIEPSTGRVLVTKRSKLH